MRGALAEAKWWVEGGRRAFQRRLIDQPMMRAVLADLALDFEGAAALAFRIARAFDGATETDRAFRASLWRWRNSLETSSARAWFTRRWSVSAGGLHR